MPLDGLHPLNKCPISSQSPRGGEASAEISATRGRAAARGGTTPEPSEHKGHVTKTKLRRRRETPRRQVLGLGGNSQMLSGTLGRGHPTPRLGNPLSGWMSPDLRDVEGQGNGNSSVRCPCPHRDSRQVQGVITSPSAPAAHPLQQQVWHSVFKAHSYLDSRNRAELPPWNMKDAHERTEGALGWLVPLRRCKMTVGKGATPKQTRTRGRCLCLCSRAARGTADGDSPHPARSALRVRTGLGSSSGRHRCGK